MRQPSQFQTKVCARHAGKKSKIICTQRCDSWKGTSFPFRRKLGRSSQLSSRHPHTHTHHLHLWVSGSMAKGKGILMILINCMFACNYNGNNAITPHVQHWVAINNKAPGQRARPVGRLSFVITPYLHPFLQASPLQSNSSGYCSSCSSCAPSGWHTSDDRIITCRATRPPSSFAFSAPAGSYSWRASTEQCIIPRGTWVRTRGVPCQKYWESFHIY